MIVGQAFKRYCIEPSTLPKALIICCITPNVTTPATIAGAPAIVAGVVTLGVMQQIIRAFGRVEGSMQYLLKAWPTIIELANSIIVGHAFRRYCIEPSTLPKALIICCITPNVTTPATIAGAPAIVAGVVTLGVMQQIIRAFGRVEGSMQYLLKAWPTIIELASVYKRLREFESQINSKDIVVEKI